MEHQSLYIFNFSKFILKVLIAFLIIGGILNYSFQELVIFKSEISGAYKVNKIIKENHKNEIPIFGSSRALRSFVPSILGDNYFNYGIAGTQANIWLFFLEEELKKDKSTPIIINYDLAGLNYSDGDIANYIPNWSYTKHILNSEGENYYNVPFIKYFGKFELYLKYQLNNKLNLTKVTDKGGSFEKNSFTPKKFKELVNKRLEHVGYFTLNPVLEKKINNLIGSTSRKIIFVVAPYHSSFFNKFQNLDRVDDYLDNLNSIENVQVIDLRDFIKEDKKFKDTTHLNYDGAIEFSQKVKENIDENRI